MSLRSFFSFKQNKMFWLNIAGMIAVVCLAIFGVLRGLDAYTRHGQSVEVPKLSGLPVEEASAIASQKGLKCIVVDSDYVKTSIPGRILDQNPPMGQRVKEGRIIYLTINSFSIPLQAVPDVADNSSLRQAQAELLASGFKLDSLVEIPGEKDWVYGIQYNGRELEREEQVPIGATLALMVGNGMDELQADSLDADSLLMENAQEVAEDEALIDDSWF